ncbi:MAG: EAL domain-containing protein [Candidatus Izemoplasmatales bacterium]
MKIQFLSDVNYPAQTYEVVAAFVIIISVSVVIYFLARNIWKEFKSSQNDKKLVKRNLNGDQKEDKLDSKLVVERRAVSKNSKDLSALINQEIFHSKEGQTISVLYYINLDNFHYIGEKYTPKQVDKAISEITKRIKKHAAKTSISGHVGEDTFLVYFTGEVNNQSIKESAEALLDVIREPLKSIPEELTASMGIVLFPFDGISASQLIKNAEVALYVSKKEGKNRYSLYSEDLIAKEQFNISYYQEIKKSISNDEFILYYQPIVDIKTGRMIGLESLLRWNHPTMGILPPGKFLNVMDLTGDITWFGKWGFEKIVGQYQLWKKKYKIRDLFISTNLSPKQLVMENLADDFHNIVKKYEFPAESFCLEIIDYYSIIRNPIALQNITEFRRYGFRIAIDDLGDQFEILEDMTRVKANIIKISREDVLKIMNGFQEEQSITKAILLAQQNQKVVVAEGIEDENMIKAMAERDIRFMQGYFFSQPKSVEDTEKIFRSSPWNADEFARITKN